MFDFKGLRRYSSFSRVYGGTVSFKAYGAVVQFGFRGLQRYTYSLFGPSKVQFVFKGLRRYSSFLRAYGGTRTLTVCLGLRRYSSFIKGLRRHSSFLRDYGGTVSFEDP